MTKRGSGAIDGKTHKRWHFWLPLVAGIILGGLSPSVWYGGDKLAALWMTFAGLVCLLLTGAFQVQAYIQSTVLQPQFEVSVQ